MAKYLVTSGSYFEPFTYEQLSAPIREAAAIHRATQDTYDQIGTEAEALRRYIEQEPDDSNARRMYDSYMSKLSDLQNNLWSNGYNAQTRRDLSAARAGYASDISRLGTAIQTRQQRSAEYWKTRHDHPDMIMGNDPGLDSLDNYLADDLYGQNYYAYSGHDFMNEVGADAKARANEMLSLPEVQRNPALVGYLELIQRDGFTNEDVNSASAAVRLALSGDNTALNSLAPGASILADVLMSHLESTGAAGNVSADEYSRLFDYGVSGLSQAVGKTNVSTVSDKVWDLNKQLSVLNYQHALSSKATGPSDEDGYGRPYSLDDISTFVKSKMSDKITSKLNDTFVKPFETPIRTSDGSIISSPIDADNILRSFGRDQLLEKYGGIDPDHPETANGNILLGQGRTEIRAVKNEVNDFDMSFVNEPYTIQRKEGRRWVTDRQMTKDFNNDITAYQDRITSWRESNPDIDIQNLALTGAKRQQLNKLGGISPDTPLELVPHILATEANPGRQTPATIAASTDAFDKTREDYSQLIIDSYRRTEASQGKIGRSDESAFYPIEDGVISNKGITIDKVQGKKGEFYVDSVYVYPEDLLNNRVRVGINGKQYAISPEMLGNATASQINKLKAPVEAIMSPLINPAAATRMNEQEIINWINISSRILGSYMPFSYKGADGGTEYITPIDVVTNPALQELLRNSVVEYMNRVISVGRDEMGLNNYRVRGNTSEKATGYNVDLIGR